MRELASVGYAQAIVSSTRAKRRVIDVRNAAGNQAGNNAARRRGREDAPIAEAGSMRLLLNKITRPVSVSRILLRIPSGRDGGHHGNVYILSALKDFPVGVM